nr:hypothetical protein [Tanacetum cinerariifolium]
MPMDPLDPYVQLVMEAPPSPDYIPIPEATHSPDYIPGPEAPPLHDYIPGPEAPPSQTTYQGRIMSSNSHATITYTLMSSYEVIVNGYYGMHMDPLDPYPLPAAVSPTAESPGYITESKPEMEPEEEDGDDEKSEEDSIEYPTSRGDDDTDDNGDDLSKDDADDEDEEESSDSEEEKEEHQAPTVPAPALHSESSVVAAARQIRLALTIADRR